MIPELLLQLKRLASDIRKCEAVNINNKVIKESAIATGSYYFNKCRSDAYKLLGDATALVDLDKDWQQLILLAHGNNAKKTYLALLQRLTKKVTDLTVASHTLGFSVSSAIPTKISYSEAEALLITTLDKFIPSAAQSYRQGIQDLNERNERYSYRGTACEFREALRDVLDKLAPDDDVLKQPWFKPEHNGTRPTKKQQVRFILSSRGKNRTQTSSGEKAVELIDSLCGEVTRAIYDRASVSAHIITSKQEVIQMKRYLDAVLFDILEIGQTE